MDKISYALGMLIAQNLKEMKVEGLNTARFAQAVTAVLSGEKAEMSLTEAQTTVQKFLQEREAEAGRAAREAGEAFLAENAKKEGNTKSSPLPSDRNLLLPTPYAATMKDASSTAPYSTPAIVVANLPLSLSRVSSADGPKVCSTWPWVQNSVSTSHSNWHMVHRVPEEAFHPMPHSFSM